MLSFYYLIQLFVLQILSEAKNITIRIYNDIYLFSVDTFLDEKVLQSLQTSHISGNKCCTDGNLIKNVLIKFKDKKELPKKQQKKGKIFTFKNW